MCLFRVSQVAGRARLRGEICNLGVDLDRFLRDLGCDGGPRDHPLESKTEEPMTFVRQVDQWSKALKPTTFLECFQLVHEACHRRSVWRPGQAWKWEWGGITRPWVGRNHLGMLLSEFSIYRHSASKPQRDDISILIYIIHMYRALEALSRILSISDGFLWYFRSDMGLSVPGVLSPWLWVVLPRWPKHCKPPWGWFSSRCGCRIP